jgi:putative aminopeptidase FrvX
MDTLLNTLIACHSTPGDEAEVRGALEERWRAAGWQTFRHGEHAITARLPGPAAGKPTLLVCAHMDSPGYALDRLALRPAFRHDSAVQYGVAELGAPELAGASARAVLKTACGRFEGVLRAGPARGDGACDAVFELSGAEASRAAARHGDRVCFAPALRREGALVKGAFLDNRLGCWLLARLSAEAGAWRSRYDVVLGATASEEMCGFGARVLAAQVRPDLAVVLDTTYEAEEQGVRLGGGTVLTLSDTSVLLSPATRDRVCSLMAEAGLPLQTEVYNFSGTDARAFPQQGLPCAVLPLLLPTRGNHEPLETADARDIEAWPKAIRAIAENF